MSDNRITRFRLTGIPLALIGLLLSVMTTVTVGAETRKPYPEYFYAHIGGGVGIGVLSSGDIEERVNLGFVRPYEITNVGADFAYSFRAGYRNIAQVEYRVTKGVGNKLFNDDSDPAAGVYDLEELEMNIDSDEWLLKFNPFFPWIEDKSMAVFLLYGQGDAEYLDNLGDGFYGGDKTLVGIEISKLFRNYMAGVSVERHSITFDRYVTYPDVLTGQEFDASYWLIQGSISVGFGF